jgi:ATP/maltotriose-dependent transcriptional regulator MalT
LNDSKTVVRALNSFTFSSIFLGDYKRATNAAVESEAISRQMGYEAELAMALTNRAHIAYMAGQDLVAVKNYLEESLALARATGSQWFLSLSLYGLARAAGASGDIETARRGFRETAELGLRMGNRQMFCASRSELAHVLREHGDLDEPLAIYREVILGWREFGHRAAVAHELECIAFILRRKGQAQPAASLLGAAEVLRQAIDSSMTSAEQIEYEREILALHAQLDEASFGRAWSVGRAMTMDEAITFALNDHPNN